MEGEDDEDSDEDDEEEDDEEEDDDDDEGGSSDDGEEEEEEDEPVKKKAKGDNGDFIPLSRDGSRGRGRGDSRGGRGENFYSPRINHNANMLFCV